MTIRPKLDGTGAVLLSFSASMRYVRPVRHFITALCSLSDYNEDETESIALVTTEILNNSIEHGARGPGEEIQVTMRVTSEVFHFECTDPGAGGEEFARKALEKAAAMPDLEEPRGRGLFLIRNYMDDFQVSYDPAMGTKLVCSKARSEA
ncbi:MAG: ATP-binding protein [Planctomycetota bacterium]|nr:ATP-binding protein [Planctomycetota bacterium]